MSRVITVNYKDVALRLLLDSATLWPFDHIDCKNNSIQSIFWIFMFLIVVVRKLMVSEGKLTLI